MADHIARRHKAVTISTRERLVGVDSDAHDESRPFLGPEGDFLAIFEAPGCP
jgi:hypothetical protein